ncbi:hypothetical protein CHINAEXTREME_18970 [Halobiforma lacisalsi AJ5]|uniref:Uncharacterized protein n=2 Tax=Natronobacterium lacisalsi TaxID=229731 RepID=M0LUQ8_NATLA|nr:hypothetical protein [Halobiforma lacisalsi]APW99724.1 hypothetical protein CHINAEXTREME_18970 [Halobiforma lacisalsi AJ5]EMA36104.1 hypothetical protein C445_04583 [Halobiforma lacisalsi AJ5]
MAALTIFGLLIFVDPLFTVLAIGSYVLPPIGLYVGKRGRGGPSIRDSRDVESGPADPLGGRTERKRRDDRSIDDPVGDGTHPEVSTDASLGDDSDGADPDSDTDIDSDSDTDSDTDSDDGDTDTDHSG